MSRERDFTSAILDARLPVPSGLQDGHSQPAGRRFSVYRNNVAVSLTQALHQGFPTVARLLGPDNMDGLAGQFLRAHPPTSPVLTHYGDAFPAYLERLPQLAHLGYLGDMARLDCALRRSYHAADAPPIDAQLLATLSPEALLASRFRFAPALCVLRSRWPIHSIWRYNTQEGAPKPAAGPEDVLITRPDYDPVPERLPPGAALWIEALQSGDTLATATETACAAVPDFDLSAPLALLIEGRALTDISR
ncbi:DNA-binding domain-containing protein [Phaeobacter sp. B1627]|uniref:HvfC/BufC N-terminal domain-containing protein n=1 Tax=Phaeobacter sp. B1627 TaxID=2583809 RepID=UPI00111BB398|nr:DNA-binding domain-containing protein [Phaeobacter sp. B1627]TNJ48231.1 DUF2063 domain-containing protein [Phaeobacter sp. B1627]